MCELIKLCEHTDFSHAYIRWWSPSLSRWLVYQANGSGIHFMGCTRFYTTNLTKHEYLIEIDEERARAMYRWCVDTAGTSYDRLELLGLGIKRLFGLFGLRIRNPFNRKGSYICCSLAAAMLNTIGVNHTLEDGETTLRDLKSTMDSNSSFFTKVV